MEKRHNVAATTAAAATEVLAAPASKRWLWCWRRRTNFKVDCYHVVPYYWCNVVAEHGEDPRQDGYGDDDTQGRQRQAGQVA